MRHGLPGLSHLLHDLKSTHTRVQLNNKRARLLHEDHVGAEALLRLFQVLTERVQVL